MPLRVINNWFSNYRVRVWRPAMGELEVGEASGILHHPQEGAKDMDSSASCGETPLLPSMGGSVRSPLAMSNIPPSRGAELSPTSKFKGIPKLLAAEVEGNSLETAAENSHSSSGKGKGGNSHVLICS